MACKLAGMAGGIVAGRTLAETLDGLGRPRTAAAIPLAAVVIGGLAVAVPAGHVCAPPVKLRMAVTAVDGGRGHRGRSLRSRAALCDKPVSEHR
jgi:hypothetical protein